MTGAFDRPLRWTVGAGALALLLIAILAGPARAATYPTAAGSTFSGGLEGWKVTSNSCTVSGLPLACSTESGYEASQGNPAGSLQMKTSYLVNALAVFKGEASFESPDFTADASGAGAVTVERAFADADLVKLTPQLEYTVSLVDKTAGASTKAIAETVTAESGFAAKQGTAPLVAGHTYAIVIAATISTGTAELGVTGSASARFDNVSLTTGGGGGNGGNGGNGNGGEGGGSSKFSDAQLESLLRSSLAGSAAVKGHRVFVKARCPAEVGAACRVKVQGMLRKGRPATAPRTAKIAAGMSRRLVLKLKPKLVGKLAKRRSLLFEETVKAAKARATVYRTLKLIRR